MKNIIESHRLLHERPASDCAQAHRGRIFEGRVILAGQPMDPAKRVGDVAGL
jgi:hypothetical protein